MAAAAALREKKQGDEMNARDAIKQHSTAKPKLYQLTSNTTLDHLSRKTTRLRSIPHPPPLKLYMICTTWCICTEYVCVAKPPHSLVFAAGGGMTTQAQLHCRVLALEWTSAAEPPAGNTTHTQYSNSNKQANAAYSQVAAQSNQLLFHSFPSLVMEGIKNERQICGLMGDKHDSSSTALMTHQSKHGIGAM